MSMRVSMLTCLPLKAALWVPSGNEVVSPNNFFARASILRSEGRPRCAFSRVRRVPKSASASS